MSQKDCTAERGSWWQNAQVSIRLRKGLSGRPPKPRRVFAKPAALQRSLRAAFLR